MLTAGNVIILLVFVAGLTLGCVYVGFRLGRYTAGQPMAPIIPRKDKTAVIEEDPYFEPMHGKPQPRIPTIPEGDK
jgi:hypothetical protein